MPASHAYPPYIEGTIFDATGKPAAGGTVEAYVAGSSVPAALWSTSSPATSLGPVVTIDGAGRAAFRLREGYAYKLRAKDKDGALIWERDNVKCPLDGGGVNIPNPMESTGDMIVGGVGGQPERLAPGAEGDALKIVSGVPTWSTDEEGMQNPMTTAGDLIVGTTGGEPARLGVGTDGDILATGNGAPTWEGGPKKYRNVYQNIPSPQIDDGYLGCLFYLSGSAQALTLPATANIPSKFFIDFVFLDGTATLTITPQGTTTLNEQGSAVTIGGQSATLYRLTFLGHGGSGDEWALGGSGVGDHKVSADGTDTAGYLEDKLDAGSGISLATSAGKVVVSAATQTGDHKTAVDGADTSPDYLAAKLAAGSGISLTNTGSAVQIAADTQTGDHQLLVSATDASAGYLGAKLTAGSNITLTTQTDGDGVQSIEISAAGGGGGGGGGAAVWSVPPTDYLPSTAYASGSSSKTAVHKMLVTAITPKAVAFALTRNSANYPMDISVGIYTSARQLCYFGSHTATGYENDLTWDQSQKPIFVVPVAAVATAPKQTFDCGEIVWLAITILWHGSGAPSYACANGMKTSIYSSSNVTASLTMLPTPGGAVLDYTPCVGILS